MGRDSWFTSFVVVSRDDGSAGSHETRAHPALSPAVAGNRVMRIAHQDEAVRPQAALSVRPPPSPPAQAAMQIKKWQNSRHNALAYKLFLW